jgi:molybdopterin-guanine dinucleotide biosynthesis protein MobB
MKTMPVVASVVGRKNSGKTTLLVALAAELGRRGLRVATVKHGHHQMEIDEPGRDSWRHFHEGGAEATLLVAGARVALVTRYPEEPDPAELVERFFAGRGYDIVLVEGYKHGPFPKVEVYRRAVHAEPIHDLAAPGPLLIALVTDAPPASAPYPVVVLEPRDPVRHVRRVAELVESYIQVHRAAGRFG